MIWLIVTGGLIAYLAMGVNFAIPIARRAYEAERKRYPSLAESNPREGMGEAGFMFVLTIFFWPLVIWWLGMSWGFARFLTYVVLPAIHQHERQKEAEWHQEHTSELERELLDSHGASGVGNVPPDPAKSRRRQRTLGEEIPYGEVEDGH